MFTLLNKRNRFIFKDFLSDEVQKYVWWSWSWELAYFLEYPLMGRVYRLFNTNWFLKRLRFPCPLARLHCIFGAELWQKTLDLSTSDVDTGRTRTGPSCTRTRNQDDSATTCPRPACANSAICHCTVSDDACASMETRVTELPTAPQPLCFHALGEKSVSNQNICGFAQIAFNSKPLRFW